MALALAGCGADVTFSNAYDHAVGAVSQIDIRRPGYLGNLTDLPPPEPLLRQGGPTGVFVQGPTQPFLPGEKVDAAIGDGLLEWLTAEERANLAAASQQAAITPTGTPVPWKALDGAHAVTAEGEVLAADNAYRAPHGALCRDLRQSVVKGNVQHLQQVTLCRTDQGAGLEIWLVGSAD